MINYLSQAIVYGGRLKDRKALISSSSGGAFTAISDLYLKNHDAVVCSTYNFNTDQQEYVIIDNSEERDKARGSKYVQSIPGEIFRKTVEWLNNHPNGNILFVGMGCQAAGFLKFIETKGLRDRVTVVDIICHGSPSPKLWNEYANNLKNGISQFDALTFKDKRHGWKNPTAIATINGEEHNLRKYVKVFYSHTMLRPACYKCPYATIDRKTDITIGEFWHIDEKKPSFYDKLGTSLFIIHSNRGIDVFEKIKNGIDWVRTNTSDCWQANLEKPTESSTRRDEFWRDYELHGINYVIDKYGYESKMVQMKKAIKKILNKKWGVVLSNHSSQYLYETCPWRVAA